MFKFKNTKSNIMSKERHNLYDRSGQNCINNSLHRVRAWQIGRMKKNSPLTSDVRNISGQSNEQIEEEEAITRNNQIEEPIASTVLSY